MANEWERRHGGLVEDIADVMDPYLLLVVVLLKQAKEDIELVGDSQAYSFLIDFVGRDRWEIYKLPQPEYLQAELLLAA